MSTAEKKVALVKMLLDADDKTTEKVFQLMVLQANGNQKFSDEELEKFHATRKRYLVDNSNTILLEDAHAYIRSLKQK